jgi:hypothetical protein
MDLYEALVDVAKRCSVVNTTPPGQSVLTTSLVHAKLADAIWE